MASAHLSTQGIQALLRALAAIQAREGWTDARLASEARVRLCNLQQWRAGRFGIGEISLWRLRVFLGKYAKPA